MGPDALIIRPATPADVDARARLWQESAKQAFTPLLPAGHAIPDPQPARSRAAIDDPALTVLVAQDPGDKELAGFAVCGPSRDEGAEPEVGEIQSFFVAAGRWRQGVGSMLMQAACDDLLERSYTEATVWSFAANERANAFYERHGFTRDGGERTEAVWAAILEVRYRRPLK